MEESRELKQLFNFLQGVVYASILLELWIFFGHQIQDMPEPLFMLLDRLRQLPLYQHPINSKLLTLLLILMVAIGTKSRKSLHLNPVKHILIPLLLGNTMFFGVLFLPGLNTGLSASFWPDISYAFGSLGGSILIHLALSNISKRILTRLGKDPWNVENETFAQPEKIQANPWSINIPMLFYYKKKVRSGWLNLTNPFRGTLLMGVPGSGKTYSYILPVIKQHLAKGFAMVVYDYKYPDLGQVAYYHYLLHKKQKRLTRFNFHVINLNEVERSRRINPFAPGMILNLADAVETAEALIEALKRSERSEGADQFFTQSAINFLAAVIYFFSRFEGGKYSSLPHMLSFINHSYQVIFSVLYHEPELSSLLSPFASAFKNKAFDQLEGQLGTLRINLARLASKETYWVFSGNDFDLNLKDPAHPGILVLENDPHTQHINSATYSVLLNRLIRRLNRKGGLPVSLVFDEAPTIYIHKVDNLIATARSNQIALTLGIQEIPQFKKMYGREAADTICAVIANVISGAVRNKETLDWLEKLFGKTRQIREGINIDRHRTSHSLQEYLENLIPAAKIANLKAGEVVARISRDAGQFNGKFEASIYHCKLHLDQDMISKETKKYVDLPRYYDFGSEAEKSQALLKHFKKINREVEGICLRFLDKTGVVK